MTALTRLSDYGVGKNPDFYWISMQARLPNDIKRYIKALGKNDKQSMIEITQKLYKLMERDYSHDDEFKPYAAFAKIALSYTRRR
jgi:hypothetical protein